MRGRRVGYITVISVRGLNGMRFALDGQLIAVLIFAASGGHLLFLPLLLTMPLGGVFGHRRRC